MMERFGAASTSCGHAFPSGWKVHLPLLAWGVISAHTSRIGMATDVSDTIAQGDR
jgi:hypothetical protein